MPAGLTSPLGHRKAVQVELVDLAVALEELFRIQQVGLVLGLGVGGLVAVGVGSDLPGAMLFFSISLVRLLFSRPADLLTEPTSSIL